MLCLGVISGAHGVRGAVRIKTFTAEPEAIAAYGPVTDEAGAMEATGHRPRLVHGREGNIKVTFPDDLALAEFWLARQENGR